MNSRITHKEKWHVSLLSLLLFPLLLAVGLRAQKQELQQRVAELKESMAKNMQALAQYTWHEPIPSS